MQKNLFLSRHKGSVSINKAHHIELTQHYFTDNNLQRDRDYILKTPSNFQLNQSTIGVSTDISSRVKIKMEQQKREVPDFQVQPLAFVLTDLMFSQGSFPCSTCVLHARCRRTQRTSQFCFFQQLIFNGPKFLRQIHIISVGIFKALYLIPKSFHLLGAVRLDFI